MPEPLPTSPARSIDTLLARLQALRDRSAADPCANPILLLALEIGAQLQSGALSHDALEAIIQRLSVVGFEARAARFDRILGEVDPEINDATLRGLFETLAGGDGAAPFDTFRDGVEREIFGIVVTAHPTFNLSLDLMRSLACLAVGRDADGEPLTEAARHRILADAAAAEHRSDPSMSLALEHETSLHVITHIQGAIRRACGILLDVAAERYPDHWQDLVPRLITVASWVGYDLDGRSDIGWTDTFEKRLRVQRLQLAHLLADVRGLRPLADGGDEAVDETLALMESRLVFAERETSEEIEYFSARDGEDPERAERIAFISRRMYGGKDGHRLTDSGALVEMVDRAVARATGQELTRRLVMLRAELANYGLGLAHTHVRINATQVHNAIRKAVGMEMDPDDPRFRLSYESEINALLADVQPVQVNFGSVMAEQTSVRQLFMLVAQMLKYAGSTAPIRFLIAETESAFTLLTALYFAKHYGVEDKVDLSPLFETERALESGSRIIARLVENPHYLAYIRKRGRLAVQTGYSDAGRFIGQTPANASIERLRFRLLRVLKEAGLAEIELVVFDTHGESIGRGAHPNGLSERLANIETAAARTMAASFGQRVKEEVSFQGGDGYLYFLHPTAAYATIVRILEHSLAPVEVTDDGLSPDPFYSEADFIRALLTQVKSFQVDLVDDPAYANLIGSFGASLLYKSGSRAFRRQHEDPGQFDRAHVSQMRAIPHNAILQQLGLLANSISGMGTAISRDPETFKALYAASPRLRQLFEIVRYGLSVSDPMIMKAYIDTLDPGMWTLLAARTAGPGEGQHLLRLSALLEEVGHAPRQNRVFRKLFSDITLLRRAVADLPTAPLPTGPDGEARDHLTLLHALRLAMILQVFRLTIAVPDFSGRHGLTSADIQNRLIHLDIDRSVEALRRIFPRSAETIDLDRFGEPADITNDKGQSYVTEHQEIFGPLARLHTLIRRTSTAIIHRIGFLG